MLSKNNRKEQFYKQEPKKQRFAIKKLTIGVASVLIGFTFMGASAYAADDASSEANVESQTPAVTGTPNNSSTAHESQQVQPTSATVTSANASQQTPSSTSTSAVSAESAAKGSSKTSIVQSASAKSNEPATTDAVNVANLTSGNALPASEFQDSKAQVNNDVKEVNNYSDFIAALGNKDVNTITLTGNIDGSKALPNSYNNGYVKSIIKAQRVLLRSMVKVSIA